jgi:2'-5' RNA ligase
MAGSMGNSANSYRLFAAIPLGEKALLEVNKRINKLDRKRWSIRWLEKDKLHFTLYFFGQVKVGCLEQISTSLNDVVCMTEPFTVSLGSMGAFPDFYLPKIVWLGMKGDQQAFIRLRKKLVKCIKQIGFEDEERGYIPHLTIGRVMNDLRFKGRRELGRQLSKFNIGEFSEEILVNKIVLYRSQLFPKGSRYSIISNHYFS